VPTLNFKLVRQMKQFPEAQLIEYLQIPNDCCNHFAAGYSPSLINFQSFVQRGNMISVSLVRMSALQDKPTE
jgi:hypothetical protein